MSGVRDQQQTLESERSGVRGFSEARSQLTSLGRRLQRTDLIDQRKRREHLLSGRDKASIPCDRGRESAAHRGT